MATTTTASEPTRKYRYYIRKKDKKTGQLGDWEPLQETGRHSSHACSIVQRTVLFYAQEYKTPCEARQVLQGGVERPVYTIE